MRTIKFRGKRIDNGEWVYGYLYELPLESGNVCMILTTDNIHKDNSTEPQYHLAFTLWKDLFVVDSSTVGQFTGLYDKNSKEIYEGDVFRRYNCAYRITYRDGQWIGIDADGLWIPLLVDQESIREYLYDEEVIGNICDNPEILKE